jgi:two-component system, OmpR family, alkaline phosphatase synthesis response regulator PhoP
MPKANILVVDDEEDILEIVGYNLSREGYQVSYAEDGDKALQLARQTLPNLIVLDIMLPGQDGLDICKILKNDTKTAHIPIILLTAKGEEVDMVTGLEVGADDYIVKPFSPRVLIARVKALLRRSTSAVKEDQVTIKRHGITINPSRFEVTVNDVLVELTSTEFALLYFLARRPGRVFSRTQIIDAIKGDDYAVTTET